MPACFVPRCKNNTTMKEKIFIRVPNDPKIRATWYDTVGLICDVHTQSKQLCCEDHFELESDAKNWVFYKTIGNKIILKEGVIPHKCLIGSPPSDKASQLTDSTRKRKLDNVRDYKDKKYAAKRSLFPSTPNIDDTLLTMPSCSYEQAELDKVDTADTKLTKDCSTQVNLKPTFRSVGVQSSIPVTSITISPIKETKMVVKKLKECISDSASSSKTSTGQSDYVPSSQSSTDDISEDNQHKQQQRLLTTTNVICKNPKFYLGIPDDLYDLVKLVVNNAQVSDRNVFVVLKKMKLDDPYKRLAIDFGMSVSNIQRIFSQAVPKIASLFKDIIFSPNINAVKNNLPIPFRSRYSKVYSIIDCLEIEIEKPTDPVNQSATWSEYKKCNTIKYLVSCTPHGFINFVSPGYAGRATDKDVVVECQYLNEVPPNSWVMADRGFKHVGSLLAQKHCHLVRPPSVISDAQHSASEVRESKRIASLRIHVERVIGRIREFRMLGPHSCVDHQLVYLMDYLMLIACGIVNIQGSL